MMSRKKETENITAADHLSLEDRIVWKRVCDTAKPLEMRPDTPRHSKPTKTGERDKKPPSLRKTKSLPHPPPSYTAVRKTATVPSAIPGVDRRMKRKLGRGQMEIDARLDLHGKSRAAAHHILKSFLVNAQSCGYRTVLIITGKGEQGIARHTLHSFDVIHTPERTGILMRSVPQWLNETDFRDLIVGYQPAHPRHGGGGALYVRLRKKTR